MAQAKGLKNTLAKIKGAKPPRVVKEVVIMCLVDLMTTSISSAFDINFFSASSFMCDRTIIESLIESPIKPTAAIVPIKP